MTPRATQCQTIIFNLFIIICTTLFPHTAQDPYKLFRNDSLKIFSHVQTREHMHTSPLQRTPSHLPGMMMLEKPSFRVMDTPWENTEEYSLRICSMSPCSSWRETANPKTKERHSSYREKAGTHTSTLCKVPMGFSKLGLTVSIFH